MSLQTRILQTKLDRLYKTYHHRKYVHPDPLEFLYQFDRVEDREIVGLVAATLAYGRVAQILNSVERVLRVLMPSPRAALLGMDRPDLQKVMDGFVHRFATDTHMVSLLWAIRNVLDKHGSLKNCFLEGHDAEAPNVMPALNRFVSRLRGLGARQAGHLLPDPEKGSASKRLHLFLRWMVRNDPVDPGGWEAVSPAKLLIPLDVHMQRVSEGLGLTRRKAADLKTVLEVTEGFRAIAPRDPVRYDFVLTRLGIRNDMSMEAFLEGKILADADTEP